MATNSMQKLINKLAKSPQFKKALDEVHKVANDLKTKATNLNINVKLPPETKEKIQEALKQYQVLLTRVNQTEKQVETEINKVVNNLRKKQSQVEKNLKVYKKKAFEQKQKLEKMFSQKTKAAATTTKKTTRKKATTKKVAKKTPARTTNKKATK